jgi:hypothetical protein
MTPIIRHGFRKNLRQQGVESGLSFGGGGGLWALYGTDTFQQNSTALSAAGKALDRF